jgi:hypothetical protein
VDQTGGSEDFNRIGFIMAMIMAIVGFVLEAIGPLTRAVIAKLGYMVFKAVGGSYSDSEYDMSLVSYHIVAGICLALGLVLSAAFYSAASKQGKRSS